MEPRYEILPNLHHITEYRGITREYSARLYINALKYALNIPYNSQLARRGYEICKKGSPSDAVEYIIKHKKGIFPVVVPIDEFKLSYPSYPDWYEHLRRIIINKIDDQRPLSKSQKWALMCATLEKPYTIICRVGL